jgi:hypothetical protein
MIVGLKQERFSTLVPNYEKSIDFSGFFLQAGKIEQELK